MVFIFQFVNVVYHIDLEAIFKKFKAISTKKYKVSI